MKIAVLTRNMSEFGGSELVALEVATYFSELGHDVTIRARNYSSKFLDEIGSEINVSRTKIDICDYDFVWSQHGEFAANFHSVDEIIGWNGVLASVHLSYMTYHETYHHPLAEKVVPLRVFNSQRTLDVLEGDTPRRGKRFS